MSPSAVRGSPSRVDLTPNAWGEVLRRLRHDDDLRRASAVSRSARTAALDVRRRRGEAARRATAVLAKPTRGTTPSRLVGAIRQAMNIADLICRPSAAASRSAASQASRYPAWIMERQNGRFAARRTVRLRDPRTLRVLCDVDVRVHGSCDVSVSGTGPHAGLLEHGWVFTLSQSPAESPSDAADDRFRHWRLKGVSRPVVWSLGPPAPPAWGLTERQTRAGDVMRAAVDDAVALHKALKRAKRRATTASKRRATTASKRRATTASKRRRNS